MKPEPWHSLEGKKVWVLGGAGYLGSAITIALDSLCGQTLCVDLESRASDLINQAKLTRTFPLSFDLSQVKELEAFVDKTFREFGLPDGIVNLTFNSSSGKALEELSVLDFQKPFDDSVSAYFILARALAERMKSRGSGSFVHFASMYGVVAPDPSVYPPPMIPNPIDYGASKAAILQMTRYFAAHYGRYGLRFNCIVPGPFPNPTVCSSHPEFVQQLSEKTPLKRVGINSEIIGPTLFLLTDSASFVTGHSLMVDGGWTAW